MQCEECRLALHCTAVAHSDKSCSWTTRPQQLCTNHVRTGLAGARERAYSITMYNNPKATSAPPRAGTTGIVDYRLFEFVWEVIDFQSVSIFPESLVHAARVKKSRLDVQKPSRTPANDITNALCMSYCVFVIRQMQTTSLFHLSRGLPGWCARQKESLVNSIPAD